MVSTWTIQLSSTCKKELEELRYEDPVRVRVALSSIEGVLKLRPLDQSKGLNEGEYLIKWRREPGTSFGYNFHYRCNKETRTVTILQVITYAKM